MNPIPNAWTSGHNKVYIVLTLGLVKRLRGEEIDAVLAHECGHIVCQHVLYQTLANAVFTLGDALMDSFIGMIGSAAIKPMKQALITWSRAAELSADRVACIVTSADTLSRALARISGIPRYMIEYMNISVWAQQGKDYEALKNGTAWNKIVRWMANSDADHPYCPVRAYEAFEWEKTTAYAQMKSCQSSLRLYRGVEAMPSVTDNIKDKVSSLTDEIKNSAVTENIKDRVSSLTKEINTSAVAENIKDRMSTLAKDAKINSMFSMFNNKKK